MVTSSTASSTNEIGNHFITSSVVDQLFFSRPQSSMSTASVESLSSTGLASFLESWIPLSSNTLKCKRCLKVLRLPLFAATRPIVQLSDNSDARHLLELHQRDFCRSKKFTPLDRNKRPRETETDSEENELFQVLSGSDRGIVAHASPVVQLMLFSQLDRQQQCCSIPLMTASERTLRYALVYPMNSSAWLRMGRTIDPKQ